MMEELALDVRPEFLQHLRDGVGAHLFAELADIRAHTVIVRIISVGDSNPGGISHPFREVETRSSRISARHHDTRKRIPGPGTYGAVAPAKIARILAKY